jgi:hypothetical protein
MDLDLPERENVFRSGLGNRQISSSRSPSGGYQHLLFLVLRIFCSEASPISAGVTAGLESLKS